MEVAFNTRDQQNSFKNCFIPDTVRQSERQRDSTTDIKTGRGLESFWQRA